GRRRHTRFSRDWSSDVCSSDLYGKEEISERHRHRFEVNNDYRETLSKAGLTLSGTSPNDWLVEIVELSDHPYFLGCQFHPEFKRDRKSVVEGNIVDRSGLLLRH